MNTDMSAHLYDYGLKDALYAIECARITHPDPEAVELAQHLLTLGKTLDMDHLHKTLARDFGDQIPRDFNNPKDFTSPFILGKPWADNPDNPLQSGESWNTHNRASNTGVIYGFDENGYPVNPFYNYGIKNRGMIGRYGPNHTVDLAPCRIFENQEGHLSFHVLGIIRNDNHSRALCGGYTNFLPDKNGIYPYNNAIFHQSQTLEFFEELVSGSVALLPVYAADLDKEIDEAFIAHERNSGFAPTEKQQDTMIRALTTHRKLQQVEQEDPQFLTNIESCFRHATPCYNGPIFSSMRNTNNAWMETRLSWFMMDEDKWQTVKGANRFNYDFQAGDDALAVLWHDITPELLQGAGSHRQLFCYTLGSYLAHSHNVDPHTLKAVKDQAYRLLATPMAPTRILAPSMAP